MPPNPFINIYNSEVRYLGREGLCKWFLNSFARLEDPLDESAFIYGEDNDILTLFVSYIPQANTNINTTFRDALSDAIDQWEGPYGDDASFLVATAELLAALRTQVDCRNVINKLFERLDALPDNNPELAENVSDANYFLTITVEKHHPHPFPPGF